MVVIWWLSQSDCESIGNQLPEDLPSWLRSQYRSRLGRPGRGRLWAAGFFGKIVADDWPATPLADYCAKCAGIVIYDDLLPRLQDLPGVVTTLSIQRFVTVGTSRLEVPIPLQDRPSLIQQVMADP